MQWIITVFIQDTESIAFPSERYQMESELQKENMEYCVETIHSGGNW